MNVDNWSDVDIAEAAKAVMLNYTGELNDDVTRSEIVRDIVAKLVDSPDLIVRCNEENNTPCMMDVNELVVDIWIRRPRVVVWCTLVSSTESWFTGPRVVYSFMVTECL